jgi:hypothetical protein
MAWTLLLGFIAFTMVYIWMAMVRYRVETMSAELEATQFEAWEAERLAESTTGDEAIGRLLDPPPGVQSDQGVARR